MVTGASDNQLRMWCLGEEGDAMEMDDDSTGKGQGRGEDGEAAEKGEGIVAVYMGSVVRQGNDRASRVRFHPKGLLLGVQGAGKMVEVFRMRRESEIKKKKKRRIKRQKEKADLRNTGTEATPGGGGAWDVTEDEAASKSAAREQEGLLAQATNLGSSDRVIAGDELESALVLRASHRVRSFDFSPTMTRDGVGSRVLIALHNNSLELWGLEGTTTQKDKVKKKGGGRGEEDGGEGGGGGGGGEGAKSSRLAVLDMHGHRSDVRALAVSSDDTLVASVSHGLAKVWSSRTKHCIRSVPCGFGLSVVFAPGDRHLLIGTKEGSLQVIDLASGDMIQNYEAHEGAIWSLDLRPDEKGLVTGSADRQVKFWDFEVAAGNLGLVHTRSLKMADDVLCVRYSRHKQASKLLVAVAILDSTVKVFHDDSLKFFLSLYGHKLPVMSMDTSDDGTLIVTGSADKTVKIWGLDFGDCHRSLLAHDDSVMVCPCGLWSALCCTTFFTLGSIMAPYSAAGWRT
ncbi:unnamed protein product [Choristocarpus tenellus]